MRAVNIKHAKAHLNELIDAATQGEQVVLMRGSKHVAAIVPISMDDLEIAPRLTDDQAARLWRSLSQEQAAGRLQIFPSAEDAAAHLRGAAKPATRGGRRGRAVKV